MQHKDTLSRTTIMFHWIVAAFMIGIIISGLYMTRAHASAIYPFHKSFGMLALFFISLRIIWRAKEGWPNPLDTHKKVEHILARIIHYILIFGTVLMPVSGILMTVMGGRALEFFGIELVSMHTLPDAPDKRVPINGSLAGLSHDMHIYSAYILIIGITLHILGALKHHFVDRDITLKRMLGMKTD